MENTKIAWATHTFSPWYGCSKVHAGCTNCYAAAMARRLDVRWGPHGTRKKAADSAWNKVRAWNKRAARERQEWGEYLHGLDMPAPPRGPETPLVFPSLCDPFEDHNAVHGWRDEFFRLIDECSALDFLLLTKRPENIRRMWRTRIRYLNRTFCTNPDCAANRLPSNAWFLYSASDQQTLEAGLPHLIQCRDLAPVLGLSVEPLLGPIDLSRWTTRTMRDGSRVTSKPHGIDWIIVGGESGPRFRKCEIGWIQEIVEQCTAASIPVFVKQDCGRLPGQQGRIPDDLWAIKEPPK